MVSINYASREVCCKIVYYGPGLSGKTTNLQFVHRKVPQNTRGKLISLATEADRTLYFDFLPINIGTINGFAAKFQLYTVPGQVYYNATRKLVLRGVDGLVFVADSQADKMDENIESLANLEDNLKEYGYDPETMPLVIQYNKRDLPGILSVEELEQKLNPRGWPCFEASAPTGEGVFGTLKLIIKLVLEKTKSANDSPRATAQKVEPEDAERETTAEATGAGTSPAAAGQSEAVATAAPASTTAAATAAPDSSPQAEPAKEKTSVSVVDRPFPGSQPEERAPSRISAGQFKPGQAEESADGAMERNVIKNEETQSDGSDPDMASPMMAPPLRRRSGSRKRGFLKRLFGVK